MKQKVPIHINLKDFFLKETFDIIKVGQTKKWILANFPEPDDDTNMGNDFSIMRYGWIELHFDRDTLFLIWCDSLPFIKNNDRIIYNKWIVDDLEKMTLEETQKILNTEKANYLIKFDTDHQHCILKIKPSGVKLWFKQNINEVDNQVNDFKLFAFGKSQKDYDTFEIGF